MCVRNFSVQQNLQITLLIGASSVLPRIASRVIHRLQLFNCFCLITGFDRKITVQLPYEASLSPAFDGRRNVVALGYVCSTQPRDLTPQARHQPPWSVEIPCRTIVRLGRTTAVWLFVQSTAGINRVFTTQPVLCRSTRETEVSLVLLRGNMLTHEEALFVHRISFNIGV